MSMNYGYIYIVNNGSNSISVIDTSSNTVIETIKDTSFNVPMDIAISPTYTTALVTNQGNDVVSVIDLTSYKVTATISGFSTLYNLVISPNGQTAYVCNEGGVAVVDLSTFRITEVIEIKVDGTKYEYPWAVSITPDGNTLYITTYIENTVAAIDLTTTPPTITSISGTSTSGLMLPEIVMAKLYSRAYIVNTTGNSILVIDTLTNAFVGTIPLTIKGFNAPSSAALSSDESQLFVTNTETSGLVQINLTADNSATMIPCSYPSYDIIITPDLRYAYISSSKNQSIVIVDLVTKAIVGNPIKVGKNPTRMILAPSPISPSSCYTYVISLNAPLTYLDTNNAIMGRIPLPPLTISMAVTPDFSTIYSASLGIGTAMLTVSNTASNTVVTTIPLPEAAGRICMGATETTLYVSSGESSATIYIVDIATNTITGQIPLSGVGTIGGLVISSDGSLAYATDQLNNAIITIDLTNNTVTNTTSLNLGFPGAIILSPDEATAYVTGYIPGQVKGQGIIASITLSNYSVEYIETGEHYPLNLSITPDESTLYVGLAQTGGILVVDIATKTFTKISTQQEGNTTTYLLPSGTYIYIGEQNIIEILEIETNTIVSQISLGTPSVDNVVMGMIFKTTGQE